MIQISQKGVNKAKGKRVLLVFLHYLKKQREKRKTHRHLSGSVAVHRSDRSSLGTRPCPSSFLLTDMYTHTPTSWQMHHGTVVLLCSPHIYGCMCVLLVMCVQQFWCMQEKSICPFLMNIISEACDWKANPVLNSPLPDWTNDTLTSGFWFLTNMMEEKLPLVLGIVISFCEINDRESKTSPEILSFCGTSLF